MTSTTDRFFENCFTLPQLCKRMRALVKVQRLYQQHPRNARDNSLELLAEYEQSSIDITFPEYKKANATFEYGLWRTKDRDSFVLPVGSKLFLLYAKFIHEKAHEKRQILTYRLRSVLWSPDLKQVVRKVIRECTYCRISNAKKQSPQNYSPGFRVMTYRVFDTIGIDHYHRGRIIGPTGIASKGIVILCVCKFSRFIIQRTVPSLEMEYVVRFLREVFSLVGKPRIVRGDRAYANIKCFPDVHFSPNESSFNPSYSGWIEAAVKIARRFTNATIHKNFPGRYPSTDQFTNAVLSASSEVNNRPLSYRLDSHEFITPARVVFGIQSIQKDNWLERWKEIQKCEQTMKIIDDHLFEHTRSTLLGAHGKGDFALGELLLYKTGIRYDVVEVIENTPVNQYLLRSAIRRLIKVRDVVSNKQIAVDRSCLRRFELDPDELNMSFANKAKETSLQRTD
jgi:hypothetical protein